MDRRTKVDDARDELKAQAFHLFPERWAQLYQPVESDALKIDGEQYEEIDDPRDLDKWFDNFVENKGQRTVNAGTIPPHLENYWSGTGHQQQQWTPWS